MEKKTALTLTAVLLGSVSVGSLPALADVTAFGDLVKRKTVEVVEEINITKDVFILADVEAEYTHGAEALTLVNQINIGNTYQRGGDGGSGPLRDVPKLVNNNAELDGGFSSSYGVVLGLNQDAGVLTKQANAVSLGLTDDDETFTNAEAAAEQTVHSNTIDLRPNKLADLGVSTSARMRNAFNNNAGVLGFNQNAGFVNDQANLVAIAVGIDQDGEDGDSAVALAEADLGQTVAFNTFLTGRIEAPDAGLVRSRTRIQGSINFNHGIVGVNQASGAGSNQGNVTSFAGAIN